jgi:hypothetical protein
MKAVLRWLVLLTVLVCDTTAWAGIEVDAERELKLLGKGVTPPKRFGNVAFRLAVFSYEDPDGLSLSDALAALASHELLAGAKVSSIGVLRYSGRLTPAPGEAQGYFDKVELLARHQEPTAALWGMVRRDGSEILIESFLQLPASTRVPGLQARLRLPAAMGAGELRATAGSDRLQLQRLRLPASAVEGLRQAAQRLGELREAPQTGAAVKARLPLGAVFYVLERREGWVRMAVSGGASGWVPLAGHCTGPCSGFLEGPRFVSQLLAFVKSRRPPNAAESLSPDARQLRDELFAMSVLDGAPERFAHEEALSVLERWQPKLGMSAAEGPALGATAANLRLMARLAGALRKARAALPRGDRNAYQRIALPKEPVRAAAYEAAEATTVDPRNRDLLHNLHVLYQWLGDTKRATLAAQLLDQAGSSTRTRW